MRISYIVPVYNGQSFILRCLDSILSQQFTGVEVVFVDDGSVDDSVRILHEVSLRHKHCRVYFQPNSGPSVARNRAIREAKGEFLAILDVDDIAIGDRSRLQFEVARDRNADLVVGGSKIVDINRNKIGTYSPSTQSYKLYEELLNRKASFHHSSCLIKASKFIALGGYNERLRQGEDLDLFLRIFETGIVAAVDDFIIEHTRHDDSLSNGANIEESQFYGIFVTACHILRYNRTADIDKLDELHYSTVLESARKWFFNSQSFKEFHFRQEIKDSRNKGAIEFLRKTLLNPVPTVLCARVLLQGDKAPVELAKHLSKSEELADFVISSTICI